MEPKSIAAHGRLQVAIVESNCVCSRGGRGSFSVDGGWKEEVCTLSPVAHDPLATSKGGLLLLLLWWWWWWWWRHSKGLRIALVNVQLGDIEGREVTRLEWESSSVQVVKEGRLARA